jgi:hypothetical protein
MKTFICARWLLPAAPFLLLFTAPATAAIYRCEANGVPVYSDRPCAEGAQPHEVDSSRVTVYESEQAPAQHAGKEPTRKPKTHPRAAQDPAKHKATCDKLNDSLRDIRTKMRTGYGIKEGERLKARQRDLAGRRRALKCG